MKTKVELLDEIVKKQEKQIRLLTDFIKLVDESETIKNSFLPYCSIKDKLRRNNIEITNLKSQLSKAGERIGRRVFFGKCYGLCKRLIN